MTTILVDARTPWNSGIGRYAANAVPRVAALFGDVRFRLLVDRPDAVRAEAAVADCANVAVEPVDLPLFAPAVQWRLPALRRGADLTWFTNYWVPLAYRAPFVAVVHDLLHLEPALFPVNPVKRILARRTFAHLGARAAGLCFDSRFSQREFERRFTPVANSAVAGIGIDHAGWAPFDPAAPPAKRRQLLVVAAPKLHKNFAVAVEAYCRARLSPGWTLVIITPGGELHSSIDLAQLVAAAGSRITLRHGLSNDALRTLYGETAVLLMPSRYEGFGLPLAEGMQAGARCISSTAPALVEVGAGGTVSYVDPDDVTGWIAAIERECALVEVDPAVGPDLQLNMRQAQTHNWHAVARVTGGVLRRALDDTKGRA